MKVSLKSRQRNCTVYFVSKIDGNWRLCRLQLIHGEGRTLSAGLKLFAPFLFPILFSFFLRTTRFERCKNHKQIEHIISDNRYDNLNSDIT